MMRARPSATRQATVRREPLTGLPGACTQALCIRVPAPRGRCHIAGTGRAHRWLQHQHGSPCRGRPRVTHERSSHSPACRLREHVRITL